MILDFDEVLSRCVQAETRMKEYENEGNVAFAAHSRKKNFGGPRNKEVQGPNEKKASVTLVTSQVTMLENALSRRILLIDDDNNNRRNGNQRNNRFKGKRKTHQVEMVNLSKD